MAIEHDDSTAADAFDPFAGPAIERTAPSTEPQREIWLATRVGTDASLAFNESVSIRLLGPLDLEALRTSVQRLVGRHESLRTTFTTDGLTLCIAADTAIAFPVIDWSALDHQGRDAAWRDHLKNLVEEPFDLERGPLLRISLIRFAPAEHRLTMTAHHLVCDGWSTGVLVGELATLYSAAVADAPDSLPPAEPFSSYAVAQRERLASSEAAEDERYWVGQFVGEIPVLDLPGDRPRPSLKTYASRREDLTIDAALVKRLKAVSVAERASLFSMLLAGFASLLFRLSSQEDLVIGIPTAGQSAVGLDRLVGHCVNLLPLRIRLTGTQPFREVLGTAKSTMLDAIDHQEFTFGRLLEQLPLRRDPSRLPLVSVIFNLDKGLGKDDLAFSGLEANLSANPRHYENFDLFLNAVELDGQVELECQYNTDLFDGSTIRQWLEAYRQLLSAAAADVSRPIAQASLVPEDDLAQIARWNATDAPFPAVSVHTLLEQQVARTPDAIAVEFEGQTITYADLNRRANQLARRLRAAGVRKGTLVGLSIERSIGMIVGMFGILKAGGGYVPLDPGYPLDRLTHMVEDSGMPVLLTERSVRETLTLPAATVVSIDEPDAVPQPDGDLTPEESTNDPESVAYVIYTSGSTGKPKGVLVPHRAVVNLLTSVRESPGMTASDVVLAITTLSFDIAVSELILPLTVGARIVLATRETASDGAQLLRLLRGSRITFVDATPSTWRLLIDAGWDGGEHLTAICTGEAMPRDLAIELVSRAGRVWNGYGPTETTVWSSFWEVKQPVDRILIGRPVANTRLYILDERMQPVPVGVPGELFIGGSGVTHGYLNRPDLTGQRFLPDPFATESGAKMYRTGDLARYLRSGDVFCLGRNDDQVKIRGFRIELGEIEEAVAQHEAVSRVAVIAREDRPGDKRLVGYIVTRDGRAVTDPELRAYLQRTLPAHMIPAVFVRLDTMPLTPSGKINRRSLPAPVIDSGATAEDFVAPRTETERMLADLWQQALGVGRVSIHDDFFALGGHSLLASQVLARLRRDHGVDILFRKLFEAPTVARFAEIVDAQAKSAQPAAHGIPRLTHDTLSPLSVMQERLWLMEMMDPQQRLVHNLPAAWRLSGPLDDAALEASLNDIIARHDTLRTSVRIVDGVAYQAVAPSLTVTLPRVDLRDRPEPDREPAMMALFNAATVEPYDLSVPPLFRATLVRIADDEHVLFILPHNLVWDGWSFDIFLSELGAAYTARTSGQPSALAPLPIDYRDFAAWQKEWLQSPGAAEQGQWWRNQLAGDLSVLELPSDRPRPAEQTRDGGNTEIALQQADVEALATIAREAGATLFTGLFAAYCVLLNRLSGHEDLLVGTPVRARTRPETEELIGPFMNMLVMRNRIDPALTFVEFLTRVRDVTLDSFSHQELPLESVGIRPPVLRAFFSLQDARTRPIGFAGLTVHQLHVLSPMAAADVMLWTMQTRRGLMAMLNYSRELFDPATMGRFLARFKAIITEVARNPKIQLGQIRVMSDEEASELKALEAGREPAATVDVAAAIARIGAAAPDTVAIIDAGTSTSYRDLDDRSNRLAAELVGRGAKEGSRVGVHLTRSADLVVALLAVLKTGAAAVILDPGDPVARRLAIVDAAGPLAIVTSEADAADLSPSSSLIIRVDASYSEASRPAVTMVPASEASIFYSVDKSGRPRAASLTYGALSVLVGGVVARLGVSAADVILAVAPPSLDASIIELLAPLAAGARVVIAGRDDADAEGLAAALAESGATLVIAPTATWRALAASESWHAPQLTTVCIGGLPPASLVTELIRRTKGVWVAHGVTDAGIWTTLHRLETAQSGAVLGTPLPGVRVRVADGHGRSVPIGVPGELFTDCGSAASRGSAGRDDDTTFVGTSEQVRWRSDGTLEFVAGRSGEVDLSGFRESLDVVSATLRKHAAVLDAAVVLQHDADGAGRLVGYIVTRPGESYTDTELRRLLRRELPDRMIPRRFTELSELPRTADGRLAVEALQRAESGRDTYAPPGTESEHFLAAVWQEALGMPRVGLHDNFFDLGGHSLLCFQVLDRIARETGRRIGPRLLLLNSLQQVAAALDNAAPGRSA